MNQRLYYIKSTVINQPLELEAKVYIFILNKAYQDIWSGMIRVPDLSHSENGLLRCNKMLSYKKKIL